MEAFLFGIVDYVIPFIVILSILVFVHEFGHYWVARRFGVKVEAFAIGFGRELFGRTDSAGTRWKFCLIPFGGYVKMFGFEDVATTKPKDEEEFSEEDKKVAFYYKPLWQKALIVFAGPLFNYIFAVIVLALLFGTAGQPFTSNVLTEVQPDGAAAAAGLQPGDEVVRIDSQGVRRFEDIQRMVQLSPGEELNFIVIREGAELQLMVIPNASTREDVFGEAQDIGFIGVRSDQVTRVTHGPLTALYRGAVETYDLTAMTFKALGQMIRGERSTDDAGGPISIAVMSGEAAAGGLAAAMFFTALLSINLGLINLFPVPVLDGGHLLFYAVEAVARRPLNKKAQEVCTMVGLFLILSLMVLVTWNDLAKLDVFDYLKGLVV